MCGGGSPSGWLANGTPSLNTSKERCAQAINLPTYCPPPSCAENNRRKEFPQYQTRLQIPQLLTRTSPKNWSRNYDNTTRLHCLRDAYHSGCRSQGEVRRSSEKEIDGKIDSKDTTRNSQIGDMHNTTPSGQFLTERDEDESPDCARGTARSPLSPTLYNMNMDYYAEGRKEE